MEETRYNYRPAYGQSVLRSFVCQCVQKFTVFDILG